MKRDKKDVKFLLIGLVIIVSLVLLVNIINSALADVTQDEQDKIPQVYKWLVNHTKGKWNTLNLKQNAFSLLALQCNSSWVGQGNKSLFNLSYYNSTQKIRCWKEQGKATSKNDCKLTETALAKLALNEIDTNTTYVDNWLLAQNRTFVKGIFWFLEIDVARGKEANCEIMYGNTMQNVTIHGDKTVSVQSAGDCILRQPFINYWFQISPTERCYNQEYTIKCFGNESGAEPVLATLLYKDNSELRPNFFVSSEISQGTLGFINEVGEEEPVPGLMQLSIPSYCLADPKDPTGECDYEGTAWATYVWQREGRIDYANKFIPYLVVYSGANEKYFPESFLSTLVGADYTAQLVREQQRLRKPQSTDYWSFWLNQPLMYGQFYDTPKAVLSLGESTSNIMEVKDYLLGHLARDYSWVNTFDAAPTQNKDTLRDTAFILWVFWQSYCPGAEQFGANACESQGPDYFCREGDICLGDEFGPYSIFNCPDGTVCCKNATVNADACVEVYGSCTNETSCPSGFGPLENILSCPDQQICCREFASSSCYDWGGDICEYGETCPDNQSRQTMEGACCMTACVPENTSGDSCFSLGGAECEPGQVCWSFITGEEISFISSLEGNCCTADCVTDSICSSAGGKDCSYFGSEYQCVDSMGNAGTEIKTTDVSACCMDDCKKPCDSARVCASSSQCKQIDQTAMSPASGVCCATECETKANLWWLIILAIILVLGIFIYFFVFKKKKKDAGSENENIDEFSDFSKPSTTKKSETSLFESFKSKPKEEAKPMGKGKGKSEEPFEDLPADFEEQPSKTKTSKGKSKAETELEETLGKLKKMSKK